MEQVFILYLAMFVISSSACFLSWPFVLALCPAPSWYPSCRCWGLLPSPPEVISAPGGRSSASLSLSWQSKCCPANNMCQTQSSIFMSSLLEGANWAGTQCLRQLSKCCVHGDNHFPNWQAVSQKSGMLSLPEQTVSSHPQFNVCQDLQGLL